MREGPDFGQRAAECGGYCDRRDYQIMAVVPCDAEGKRWQEVLAAVAAGEYDVIVVRDREDLSPDRVPRLEVVSEEERHKVTPPAQREEARPQRIRRLRPPGGR